MRYESFRTSPKFERHWSRYRYGKLLLASSAPFGGGQGSAGRIEKKTISAFFSTLIEILISIFTIYLTLYAIAWAKYEFHATRQSQQANMLIALSATDKRKSFAPALAELTNKKLPIRPTLLTPKIIVASLFDASDDEIDLTEDNRDTIDMVARILSGFGDWQGATFYRINLNRARMAMANLSEARLNNANLKQSWLVDAKLRGAQLPWASFENALLMRADLTLTDLRGANFTGAILTGAHFAGAYMHDVQLKEADLSGANLTEIDLSTPEEKKRSFDDKTLFSPIEDVTERYVNLLCTARTLHSAILPQEVEVVLRRNYPQLFEGSK